MAFNIFAGARRIASILALLLLASLGYFIATEKPYLAQRYVMLDEDPGVRPVSSAGICPYPDKEVSGMRYTPSGHSVVVSICVPEALRSRAPFVDQLAAGWIDRVVSDDELRKLDDDAQRQLRDRRVEYLQIIGAALIVLGTVTLAVGWVVRGFLGIPRGMDRRPDPTEGKADGS